MLIGPTDFFPLSGTAACWQISPDSVANTSVAGGSTVARLNDASAGARITDSRLPSAGFQTRASPSPAAQLTSLPSAVNARLLMLSSCALIDSGGLVRSANR